MSRRTDDIVVGVHTTGAKSYPSAPYSPDESFPEYQFSDTARERNAVYEGVRQSLMLLGLDVGNQGGPAWNPLGDFIQPGSRVVIKPNLVIHAHPLDLDPAALVTHAAILRPIIDYVLIAGGVPTIADAPLQSCDFRSVLDLSGIHGLLRFYEGQGIRIPVHDLRLMHAVPGKTSLLRRTLVQATLAGDPNGYISVNLGAESLHARNRVAGDGSYRVTNYDPDRMQRHHSGNTHEYVISGAVLAADCIINVPKMKTHKKAGITGALKNFVGINGYKDCLPHYVKGAPEVGGDEYLSESWSKRIDSWLVDVRGGLHGRVKDACLAAIHHSLRAVYLRGADPSSEGSWYGNDTISRTVIDLARIACFADKSGVLHGHRQRKVLTIVDGIVAGDGEGPIAPTPQRPGLVIAGCNPVAVDLVLARLMGFDGRRIPTLIHALADRSLGGFGASDVVVESNDVRWKDINLHVSGESLEFAPPSGWRNHIEL